MRSNLRKRLAFIIITTILIFGAIATLLVFFYSRNIIVDIQKNNLKNLTIENALLTEELFDDVIDVSKIIIKQDKVKNYLQQDNFILQDQEVLSILNDYKINEYYDVIYLMDNAGRTLVSTDETFVNNNYSFRDYFTNARAGYLSVDVAVGATSKKLGYYISSPVLHDDKVMGVLVIKLKPEMFEELSNVAIHNKDSNIMIVDNFGVIIYSNILDRVYKSLGPLSYKEISVLKDKKRYEGINISSLNYEEIKENLNNDSVGIFEIYDSLDERNELLSVIQIKFSPFYLVIEENIDKYIQVGNNIAIILSFIVFITALISTILIFFFLNNIVKPINQLTKAAKEIASGNLQARADIRTGDEIETLSKAFNSMAVKLSNTIKNREQEIEKRTKKLEDLNNHMIGRELKMIELKNKLKNKKDK